MVEINGNLTVGNVAIAGTITFVIENHYTDTNGFRYGFKSISTEIDRDEAIKLVNTIMSAFDIDYKEIDNGN